MSQVSKLDAALWHNERLREEIVEAEVLSSSSLERLDRVIAELKAEGAVTDGEWIDDDHTIGINVNDKELFFYTLCPHDKNDRSRHCYSTILNTQEGEVPICDVDFWNNWEADSSDVNDPTPFRSRFSWPIEDNELVVIEAVSIKWRYVVKQLPHEGELYRRTEIRQVPAREGDDEHSD